MPLLTFFVLLAAFPLHAHAGMQSAFTPKGKDAAQILDIAWVMFIGGGLIFAAVMLLLLAALFGTPAMRAMIGRPAWVIGGGVVFPLIVLSALLTYSLMAVSPMLRAGETGETVAARIEVTGELWWWRVRYLDERDNVLMETANEIHLPVGRPVDLLLRSDNVIHSFWVPSLAGKIDMMPGKTNRQRVRADEAGTFRGQCAEYCGAQHAQMALYVVARDPEEYEAWLAAQARPAAEPDTHRLRQGRQLFMDNRCGVCHAIHGTPAAGGIGPDLTHVGGRRSLAAGILPAGEGSFAGWITGNQHLKPGNRMPAFNRFSGDELRTLSAYLESLQ